MSELTANMTRRQLEAKAAEHNIDVSGCRTKDEVHQTLVREMGAHLRGVDNDELGDAWAEPFAGPDPVGQMGLADAIPHILADLKAVPKSGTAPAAMGGFAFRRQEDITGALRPLFAKYGLSLIPEILERTSGERTTSGNKTLYVEDVRIRFTTASGELVGEVVGQGTDSGDKAVQKAITSAFKSLLTVVFLISDAGDDSEASEYGIIDDLGQEHAASLGRVEEILERLDAVAAKLGGYPQAWKDARLLKREALQAVVDDPESTYLPLEVAVQCEAVLDGAEAAIELGADSATGEKLEDGMPENMPAEGDPEPAPAARPSREDALENLKETLARTDAGRAVAQAAAPDPCPTCGGSGGEHAKDCPERPF